MSQSAPTSEYLERLKRDYRRAIIALERAMEENDRGSIEFWSDATKEAREEIKEEQEWLLAHPQQ